jgi:hypothetical protein
VPLCTCGNQPQRRYTSTESLLTASTNSQAAHASLAGRMPRMVALGGVGIVFGLEVSRLARNNRDWYQLLDLCSVTDTLIGDGDGVYHPALPDDRLILGLRGTMSEAELHVMQARLQGGSRNKATRGELRVLVPIWSRLASFGRAMQTSPSSTRMKR